jgi:hypothetical protein
VKHSVVDRAEGHYKLGSIASPLATSKSIG